MRMRPRRNKAPIARSRSLAREELPAPLVYYPSRYGAFIAFAANREEPPALCTCAEEAVRNLGRLGEPDLSPDDYSLFPDVLTPTVLDGMRLTFHPGLCHLCNGATPTLRYCHEAEGQRFVQTYGWYINQRYLRLGIHPVSHRYLPDVCPPEYHDVLGRIGELTARVRAARAERFARINQGLSDESQSVEAIEQQLNRPRREVANAIQNLLRAELGVRPVGDAWLSETELYRIVAGLFEGEQVLRHHRPEWLEGLELDLYLPARRLAFEYQGEQHFTPIKAWGGEEALVQLQARDARKADICRRAGVELITIAYHEPLSEDHILQRLIALGAIPRPASS